MRRDNDRLSATALRKLSTSEDQEHSPRFQVDSHAIQKKITLLEFYCFLFSPLQLVTFSQHVNPQFKQNKINLQIAVTGFSSDNDGQLIFPSRTLPTDPFHHFPSLLLMSPLTPPPSAEKDLAVRRVEELPDWTQLQQMTGAVMEPNQLCFCFPPPFWLI